MASNRSPGQPFNYQQYKNNDNEIVRKLVNHLEVLDREMARLHRELESAERVSNTAIREKDRAVREKDRAVSERDTVREGMMTAIRERNDERQRAETEREQLKTDKQQQAYTIQTQASQIGTLTNDLRVRNEQQQYILQLQQALDRELQQNIKQNIEHKRELEKQSLEHEAKLDEKEAEIKEQGQRHSQIEGQLRNQIRVLEQIQHGLPNSGEWVKGQTAPRRFGTDTDVVVHSNVAYFRPCKTREIYKYDSMQGNWSNLPDCSSEHTTLAIVNSCLTTVGGEIAEVSTDKLFSFEPTSEKWNEKLPSMHTARSHTVVVTTATALIVAGGMTKRLFTKRIPTTVVEVMNTKTRTWCRATDLPNPLHSASPSSAAVFKDHAYIFGNSGPPSRMKCSIPVLLNSCHPDAFRRELSGMGANDHGNTSVWTEIADPMVTVTTCYTFNDQLFVVGYDVRRNQSYISKYDHENDSWKIIDLQMLSTCDCQAVVLPSNHIMLVSRSTDVVWFKTLIHTHLSIYVK